MAGIGGLVEVVCGRSCVMGSAELEQQFDLSRPTARILCAPGEETVDSRRSSRTRRFDQAVQRIAYLVAHHSRSAARVAFGDGELVLSVAARSPRGVGM